MSQTDNVNTPHSLEAGDLIIVPAQSIMKKLVRLSEQDGYPLSQDDLHQIDSVLLKVMDVSGTNITVCEPVLDFVSLDIIVRRYGFFKINIKEVPYEKCTEKVLCPDMLQESKSVLNQDCDEMLKRNQIYLLLYYTAVIVVIFSTNLYTLYTQQYGSGRTFTVIFNIFCGFLFMKIGKVVNKQYFLKHAAEYYEKNLQDVYFAATDYLSSKKVSPLTTLDGKVGRLVSKKEGKRDKNSLS